MFYKSCSVVASICLVLRSVISLYAPDHTPLHLTLHHTTCTAQVLQCISQLELAQLIGAGVKTRYLTFASSTPQKAPLSRAAIDAVLSGTGMGPPLLLLHLHLTLHTPHHISSSTPLFTSHPPHFSHLTLHTSPHISPSTPPLTSHPPHLPSHLTLTPPLTSHPPHLPSHLTLTPPLTSHPPHTSPHISPPHLLTSHLYTSSSSYLLS